MFRNSITKVCLALFATSFTSAFADSASQREANAIKEWQKTGDLMALREVASAREEQGKYSGARAALQLLKSRSGSSKMSTPEGTSNLTWAQVVDFTDHRLARKINLAAQKPAITPSLRWQLAEGVQNFKNIAPADQLDSLIQADLDGDAIDELVYIGSNGPIGKRVKNAMGIAKWDGKAYKIVWKNTGRIPFMVHIIDNDGDGWKEMFCGYTPDSDDAATLYFNGRSAIWL